MTEFSVPTVSVIIPTYNSASTIQRALRSIHDQTTPVNEVIVVDDASSDSTVELVRQFSNENTDLTITVLVNETNSGPGICRNTAWNRSQSEFVCFLDADDSWHSRKTELQLGWMLEHPSAMICGTLHSVGPVELDLRTQSSSTFTTSQLMTRNRFTTPSVMVRRVVPLRFDESLTLSEDYLLWMRFAATYGVVHRFDSQLTFLHKAEFGASGLSSHFLAMFVGELKAILLLRQYHDISRLRTYFAILWSTVKFIKRTPRSIIRHIFWKVAKNGQRAADLNSSRTGVRMNSSFHHLEQDFRPMKGCLLVDSEHITTWQMESLRLSMPQDLDISAVIWCTNSFSAKHPIKHFAYYVLNLLSIRNRWSRAVGWTELIRNDVPIHRFEAETSGAWQSIPINELEILKGYELDVVIKFGMNLLRDPNLIPAKYGVLSFHHGDPGLFRGRPAGFYELIGRHPRIGVIVQQLSNTLDGGTIRALGNFKPVMDSYRKSLEHIYQWGATLLPIALRNCRADQKLDVSTIGTNYRIPSNTIVLRFMLILFYRKIRRVLYGIFIRKRWELSEIESIDISNLESTVMLKRCTTIKPPKGSMFVADPFFVNQSTLLCEVTKTHHDQGHLAKYQGDEFTTLDTSILGPHRHLSYPGTVQIEDCVFMIPEMAQYGVQQIIKLGIDHNFVSAEIIRGVEHERLIDPTMMQWKNHWWLFAGKNGSEQDLLFLWLSTSIDGPFTEHPMNPIVADPSRARGAGAIIEIDERLFRFGQDNLGDYGNGITVSEITCLTPTIYSETPIANLRTKGRYGPHTMAVSDKQQFIDSYIHVFDPVAWYPRLRAKFRPHQLTVGK